MAKWIEYTGIDIHQALNAAKHGFLLKGNYFEGSIKYTINASKVFYFDDIDRLKMQITEHLICAPHPYADEIKIWADTGCPVWVRYMHRKGEWDDALGFSMFDYLKTESTNEPNWNIPGAEYRLTPFED